MHGILSDHNEIKLWNNHEKLSRKIPHIKGVLLNEKEVSKGITDIMRTKRQCQRMLKLPITLISHASKVMLKIFKVRLQQYVNHEPSDVQAGFRKGRRTRDQIANIC